MPAIRQQVLGAAKTLVVLDDDPTGTQTSYGVKVLTQWSVPLLVEELQQEPAVLFILTNSRSMSEAAAVQLTREIGHNLKAAVQESGRQIVALSRSDSTLRGHFPAEVDALAEALDMSGAVTVLLPAFLEGGRVTIQDVHYIREQEQLVPVARTPFAQDAVFGYNHSNLRDWVEEKTKGKVPAGEVISFSLEEIRQGGPDAVCQKLITCPPGATCVVNASAYKDLEVFAMGVIMAEKAGHQFIYRTSATFVPIRAGMTPGKLFQPRKQQLTSAHGSLVVVGSYVPKTTSQLTYLLQQQSHQAIEVNVSELLRASDPAAYVHDIIRQADAWLQAGKDVLIYTSRNLETGTDAESNLRINSLVSGFLVSILQGLEVRPAFIVAKGGITSSDLATRGLGVVKALVLGQVIPGVPVWQLNQDSKFPDLIYVVFPGNVGDEAALTQVYRQLKM